MVPPTALRLVKSAPSACVIERVRVQQTEDGHVAERYGTGAPNLRGR